MASPLIKTLEDVYNELKNDNSNVYTICQWQHKYKTLDKPKTMQLGRIWYNLILPDDFDLIDEEVNGKMANNHISMIIEKYPPMERGQYLTKIIKEISKLGTIEVSSFNENSFIIPKSSEIIFAFSLKG